MRWLVAALAVLLVAAAPARAADDFIFNDDVHAITHGPDGATYIGGNFTAELKPTGGGLIVDASASGYPDQATVPFPQVQGSVYAVTRDGSDGWFVGGRFQRIGAYEVHNLAHITAAGTVDTAWRPDPDGDVRALTRNGTTLYLGGGFQTVGEKARFHAAAIDAGSAAVLPWVANTNADVRAIAVSGATVFLGGAFTDLRNHLAAVDATTGALKTLWNPSPDGVVDSLAVRNSTLYVGGWFANVAGQPRMNLAAVDTSTGALGSLQLSLYNPGGDVASVDALAISGATLFIGGTFDGPASQNSLLAYDLGTGDLTAFQANLVTDSHVNALTVVGSTLYVGGSFGSRRGGGRGGIAALDVATAAANDFSPQPGGTVYAIAATGARVYIGGEFAGAGPTVGTLNGLARLRPDGSLDTGFHPDPGQVNGLAMHGSQLYVGGWFTGIATSSRPGLAAISTTTGGAAAWHPVLNPEGSGVETLTAFGGRIYVGGSFYGIDGGGGWGLAAVDPDSGVTPFSASLDWDVFQVLPGSAGLFLRGAFQHAGGSPRNQLAAVDPVSGALLAWDSGLPPNATASGLAVAGSTVYVSGGFDHLGGKARASFGAVDTTTGAATAFAPTLNGTYTSAVAVLDGTVYAAGDFTAANGQPRRYLAAFDAATGALKHWDPQIDSVPTSLLVEDGKLYAAGGFVAAGGKVTGPFALLDTTAPDTTVGADGSFGSNEAGVSYECSVGGGTFTPCAKAPDGAFAVRAVDFTGNADATPASFAPTPPAPPATVVAPVITPAPVATPTATATPAKKPSKLVTIVFTGAYKIGKVARVRGCRGALTLDLKHGKTLLERRSGKLDSRCRYKTTFSVARTKVGSAKQLTVEVRFRGNKYLAATTDRFPVRVPA